MTEPLKGEDLLHLLAHLLQTDVASVRAKDWQDLALSASLLPRAGELEDFFSWVESGEGHPPFDCDECGGPQHVPWSAHERDWERRKALMGDAVILYDEVVKLFEGRDLAVVDEVIRTLDNNYKIEERLDLGNDV